MNGYPCNIHNIWPKDKSKEPLQQTRMAHDVLAYDLKIRLFLALVAMLISQAIMVEDITRIIGEIILNLVQGQN